MESLIRGIAENTAECVIAVPTVDLLDKVVWHRDVFRQADTDKFASVPGSTPVVRARAGHGHRLIKECLANIECKVIDIVKKHNIVVLEAVAAHIELRSRKEKRTVRRS